MRIGYSFWGFLGPGIVDTPDGGRSHRPVFIEALARDHDIVMLQRDRDRVDASSPVALPRVSWDDGLPELDLLFLEWRWPIRGRSVGVSPDDAAYTPDVDRQRDLLEAYTERGVPTLVWDKDLQLDPVDPIRRRANVVVLEAAVFPRGGARTLLFPIADEAVRAASWVPRDDARWTLAYVGNQYRRDEAFARYFAPAAASVRRHAVFGKWTSTAQWPHVRFAGRIAFPAVREVYSRTVCTVLLLPDVYAATGQMTSRLTESVLNGCIPLAPRTIAGVTRFVPESLVVHEGADVVRLSRRLDAIGASGDSAGQLEGLWRECAARLEMFRVCRQLEHFEEAVAIARRSTRRRLERSAR